MIQKKQAAITLSDTLHQFLPKDHPLSIATINQFMRTTPDILQASSFDHVQSLIRHYQFSAVAFDIQTVQTNVSLIQSLQREHIPILSYTINDISTAQALASHNIRIFTDNPTILHTIPNSIAHRGYHTSPKHSNTQHAFLAAAQHNIQTMEYDVRQCKDTIIIYHDPCILDTTGAIGAPSTLYLVHELSYSQLTQINPHILSFNKLLNLNLNTIQHNIEIKQDNSHSFPAHILRQQLQSCEKDTHTLPSIILSSFHQSIHDQLKAAPSLPQGPIGLFQASQ